jgi:hypothetical protein
MNKALVVVLMFSSVALAKRQSDKEILDLFTHTPVCTDFGTIYGFNISNLDGHLGSKGKVIKITENQKDKSKPNPKNECVSLPENYAADIIEKDECRAFVVVHPNALEAEQAKYLASKIHTPPYRFIPEVRKPNFNPDAIPFKNFKDEWEKLAKFRESGKEIFVGDWNNPKAKAFVERYSKTFKDLSTKTLAAINLQRSDIETVDYGYMGCD